MHIFKYEALSSTTAGDTVRLDKEESAHLFRTLRAEPGEKCRLMDGAGHFAQAEVVQGKMLKRMVVTEDCSLNVSDLASGMYLLRLQNNNGIAIRKVQIR